MSGCWCHAERSPVTDRKEKQKVFKLLEILLGKTRLSIPVRVPGLAGKRREHAVCTGMAKKRKNPRWRDLSVPQHTGIAVEKRNNKGKDRGKERNTSVRKSYVFHTHSLILVAGQGFTLHIHTEHKSLIFYASSSSTIQKTSGRVLFHLCQGR